MACLNPLQELQIISGTEIRSEKDCSRNARSCGDDGIGLCCRYGGEGQAAGTDRGYNWTGFYVGLNAGGGFGRTNASETGIPETGVLAIVASANYGLNHDLTGAFGGAATATNFVTASEKIDYFGTARLRAGFLATPALLLYGTGGLAWADVKTSGQFHYATPVDYFAAGTRIQAGWTVGAGAEWKLANNWSFKGEYLYYDLGHTADTSNNGIPPFPPFQSRFDCNIRGSLARVGFNYQFAGPVVAKY